MKLKLKYIEHKPKYNEQRFIVSFETELSKDQFKCLIDDLKDDTIIVKWLTMLEPTLNIMQSISPTLIIIGVFGLAIGCFVFGIKFMFYSFYELDIIIERWKSRKRDWQWNVQYVIV